MELNFLSVPRFWLIPGLPGQRGNKQKKGIINAIDKTEPDLQVLSQIETTWKLSSVEPALAQLWKRENNRCLWEVTKPSIVVGVMSETSGRSLDFSSSLNPGGSNFNYRCLQFIWLIFLVGATNNSEGFVCPAASHYTIYLTIVSTAGKIVPITIAILLSPIYYYLILIFFHISIEQIFAVLKEFNYNCLYACVWYVLYKMWGVII